MSSTQKKLRTAMLKASQSLIDAMEVQNNVLRVDQLAFCASQGLWLYLIETPFDIYPRFVVGWTNEKCDAMRIVTKHAAHWSALASFFRVMEEEEKVSHEGTKARSQEGDHPENTRFC